MKNFDFPYINDSPLDLSGREGAPAVWYCDECEAQISEEDDHEHVCAVEPENVPSGHSTQDESSILAELDALLNGDLDLQDKVLESERLRKLVK